MYRVPCKYRRAAHDSGPRQASAIDLVVIHSAESTSAAGVASYFAGGAQASTQLAVDDKECWRMLPDLVIPWGAPGANSDGLHIEMCGYAAWSKDEWLAHMDMLERAAVKAAKWCWQYKIPRRWLTIEELKADRRGFTTHVDVNAAFRRSDHWDPGYGFPRLKFLQLVRKWYAVIASERAQ